MATIAQAFTEVGQTLVKGMVDSKLSTVTKGNITDINSIKNPTAATNTLINRAASRVPGTSGVTSPIVNATKSTLTNNITGMLKPKVNAPVPAIKQTFKQQMANAAMTTVTSALPPEVQGIVAATGFSTNLDNRSSKSIATSLFRRDTQVFSSQTYGYTGDFGREQINSNQLITISLVSSSENYNIQGKLQKDFSLTLNSDWDALVPPMEEFEKYSKIVQMGSAFAGMQTSLGSPVTSRRIWKGTSPMQIVVDIMFMTNNEGKTREEVIIPCLKIQNLILPSYGDNTILGLPILNPPGPNPLSLDLTGQTGGDQVTVSIGGMFTMNPVIVKQCTVTYDNRLDSEGLPLSAKASITFETYQVIVKSELLTFFKMASGNGALSAAIPQTKEDAFETAKAASNTDITLGS